MTIYNLNLKQEQNNYIITLTENDTEIGMISYVISNSANDEDIRIVINSNLNSLSKNVKTKIINAMGPDKNIIHIQFLRVNPIYQGKGWSKIILKIFLLYLKECHLEQNFLITLSNVTDKIQGKQTFWEKLGAIIYTEDSEAIIIDIDRFIVNLNKGTSNININILELINKICKSSQIQTKGGSIHIMTKRGKRKIHIGKRGGKYYILDKKKYYIK
jgi:hypothetical protein